MNSKKFKLTALASAVGISAGMLAFASPAANADGLGGISGWEPPTAVCGSSDYVPVLITNATGVPQTGSMTIGGDLTEQVQLAPMPEDGCPDGVARDGSGRWQQTGSTFSQNLTVAPGETFTFMLSLGGVNENLIGTSNTFSIGGLPNGTPNASWYDFDLSMNGDGSFSALYPYYSNTGGTDASTNGQNGFNIVACSPATYTPGASNESITPTAQVMTPYSSGKRNATNYSYGWNQPMCMAWLPEGPMVTSQVTMPEGVGVSPVASILAAQQNSNSAAVVFSTTGPVAQIDIVGRNGQFPLSTVPGNSNGWWYQEASTGNVIIEGAPYSNSLTSNWLQFTVYTDPTSYSNIFMPGPGVN